ncbi:MAG: tRNA dihydrouridine(20/20a) synthase DusA, partial [Pontibacterium sp.]
RFLDFNDGEQPVALQLGGSDPKALAECTKMGEQWGYNEVNLNVGCPSDRVQNNMIGACLMGHPKLVADCIAEMQNAVDIPVTIKHRLGIDDAESFDGLCEFVETVAETGCKTFIVHARKAILQGLSPKENRDIPPLRYEWVYKLKALYPQLEIIINGGIKTLDECETHLQHVDGVMVGREAYQNPYMMSQVDARLYGDDHEIPTRNQIVRTMLPYVQAHLDKGLPLSYVTRHMLGIFHAQRGGKQFRRYLSENAHKKEADVSVLEAALALTEYD